MESSQSTASFGKKERFSLQQNFNTLKNKTAKGEVI
jgi:hypothetical protein